MSSFPSEDELDRLAISVDEQLRELHRDARPATFANILSRGASPSAAPEKPLSKQREAIRAATGEDPDTFLKKFLAKAREDLCLPGGMLFQQWAKARSLATKDALKTFGPIIAALGLTQAPLLTVTAAVTVIVIHIGINTICDGMGK